MLVVRLFLSFRVTFLLAGSDKGVRLSAVVNPEEWLDVDVERSFATAILDVFLDMLSYPLNAPCNKGYEGGCATKNAPPSSALWAGVHGDYDGDST